MFHYVYEIRCETQFYIGCRSSRVPPDEDARYMGSGVWSLFYPDYGREKTVLSVWKTRRDAEVEESRLIRENIRKPGCMNRKRSSPKSRRSHV